MVAQFNCGDDDLEDRERFPVRPPLPKIPEPVIQIRMDPKVWEDPASKQALKRAVAEMSPSDEEQRLDPPLAGLLRLLRTLGAVSVAWPLSESGEIASILTADELLQRRAILNAHFRADVDLIKAADALRDLPAVLEVMPLPGDAPPVPLPAEELLGSSGQNLDKQWYVFRVRAHKAWAHATGKNVVIGDVDYGFRVTHQDLLTNIELGQAFNTHDGSTNVTQGDRVGHGPAVLGLAGAARNGHGVMGIAYESKLWPIQANRGVGAQINEDKWAAGIDRINATSSSGRRKVAILEVQAESGGCYEMVSSIRTAIDQAIAHGVIVVVPAGNGMRDVNLTDHGHIYQASGSILVGATTFHRRSNPRLPISNFGPRVTVSAPGYELSDVTCGNGGDADYRHNFGGTSSAAPKVAAACALMLEVNGGLSHQDVKDILIRTGSEVVTSPNMPAGVFLNVEAAVIAAAAP